jgi:hypothetical protein
MPHPTSVTTVAGEPERTRGRRTLASYDQVQGDTVLTIVLLIAWVFVTTALLLFWARLHIEARAETGIDEGRYVNGLDDRSLQEAT